MKRLIDGLLGLIIGIILILFLTPKHENTDDLIKQKDKEHLETINNLSKKIKNLEQIDEKLSKVIIGLESELKTANRETKYHKSQYDKLKNTPVRHFTDFQIDSILTALYRNQNTGIKK